MSIKCNKCGEEVMALPIHKCMTRFPKTDQIFKTLYLASHPEADYEHHKAYQEAARIAVEDLEREADELREALQRIEENNIRCDSPESNVDKLRIIARTALRNTEPKES